MAISKVNPVAGGKTRYLTTLTSGTSWTVPAGVTYVNVTLVGGGGGSSGNGFSNPTVILGSRGGDGSIVSSTLSTTPGAAITYAIGAGGTAGTGNGAGSPGGGGAGGATTFTGATSASGGAGGGTAAGSAYRGAGGNGGNAPIGYTVSAGGSTGGSGSIDIEYWA